MIALLPTNAPATIEIGRGGIVVTPNTRNSDIPSIARGHLTELFLEIRSAIPRTSDKLSKYHLQDEAQRIGLALNPKS
ncbi:MAG: hypothetical protein NVS3B19_18180 [Ginsengibacter sp.]